MKLTLAVSFLVTTTEQVAAQYYVDYYFVTTSGYIGSHGGCGNIPPGDCCELYSASTFFPTARTGSYGPAGVTVWTQTDSTGSYCVFCTSTTSWGCFLKENPFETAFIVGLPTVCRNGVVRRSIDMASSENTTAANATEPALRCNRKVPADRLGINARDYAITDENRKEIMEDFINQTNLKFDFAEKWKASYTGPTNRIHFSSEPLQEKPRTVFKGIDIPKTEG